MLALDKVVVREHDAPLDVAIHQAAIADAASAERAGVTAAVRAMYRRVGIDPTKTRPSSEALLRRVRKGEPLPRVNTAVDIVNWCSLESQLPFGLYDLAAIDGGVTLRLGATGEQYGGIRKDVVHLDGRLTLADARGPFGNPTSDSARTMVTTATTRLLVVIFAPATLPGAIVQRALAVTRERLVRFCGGVSADADRDSPGGPDS
ncbi:MAG: hypothetical protein IT184_01130 [Acidobacteria bacterium]|nr:hypothetical protein [Acidobacteriota bacterium]